MRRTGGSLLTIGRYWVQTKQSLVFALKGGKGGQSQGGNQQDSTEVLNNKRKRIKYCEGSDARRLPILGGNKLMKVQEKELSQFSNSLN